MKVVVITGSTRGIGFGLARALLERGCAVVVNGRTPAAVERAAAALTPNGAADRLLGIAADMGKPDQIQALWDGAQRRFGRVDLWINNAALENRCIPLWELSPDEIRTVVDVNLTGVMIACAIALRGMAGQGGGSLYLMEGFGSDGRVAPGMLTYATTKAAIRYLTRALVVETAGLPVIVGAISPGMVVTDMLLDNIPPERMANAKRIFNILADRVETVTPWLADRLLAEQKTGAYIDWLPMPKLIGRFLLARFRQRDLFADD